MPAPRFPRTLLAVSPPLCVSKDLRNTELLDHCGCCDEVAFIKFNSFACARGDGFVRIQREVEVSDAGNRDPRGAWYSRYSTIA